MEKLVKVSDIRQVFTLFVLLGSVLFVLFQPQSPQKHLPHEI